MPKIIFLNDIFDPKDSNELDLSQFEDADDRNEYHLKQMKNFYKVEDDSVKRLMGETAKFTFWSRYMGPYAVANSIIRDRPDWTVDVIDYFTKIPDFHEYIKNFITPDTEYIGISTTFLNHPMNKRIRHFNLWHDNHDECLEWFRKLKEIAPHVKIIIGGAQMDHFYKLYFKKTNSYDHLPDVVREYVDYIFVGYAEESILQLLDNTIPAEKIQTKENTTFIYESKVAGTGAVIHPTYWQRNWAISRREWLPIEISKGCRFSCKFCFYDTRGTIIKDPADLYDELMYNYKNFGTTGYHLTDDTVNDSPEKIDMMHDVIKRLPFDMEWIAYTRPDMFHKYPEMYDKMLDMGCRGMFLGIETLGHDAGKIAGKGLHPDKIKEICNWLRDKGGDEIFILASFIVGLIGETEETLWETGRWLRDQRCLDKVQYELLTIGDGNERQSASFGADLKKFGIEELTWEPEYYWKHSTMDLKQARKMSMEWEKLMIGHPFTAFERHHNYNTNFWAYPRLRSLGYKHKEAVVINKSMDVPSAVYEQNTRWIQNYHHRLANKIY